MPTRLFIHLGPAPADALRAAMWDRKPTLAKAGLLLPLRDPGDHDFLARQALRPKRPGPAGPSGTNLWPALGKELEALDGTALLSSGVFAELGAVRLAAFAQRLRGLCDEVHAVAVVTDPARAVRDQWLRELGKGSASSLESCLTEAYTRDAPRPPLLSDPVALLGAWVEQLGASSVHLVTTPPGVDPSAGSWPRLAGLLGVDPGEVAPAPEPALGRLAAEVLRRVNEVAPRPERPTVEAARRGAMVELLRDPDVVVDDSHVPVPAAPALVAVGEAQAAAAREAAVDVVGDAAELVPAAGAAAEAGPPDESRLAELLTRLVPRALGYTVDQQLRPLEAEIQAQRARVRQRSQRISVLEERIEQLQNPTSETWRERLADRVRGDIRRRGKGEAPPETGVS